MTVKSPPCKPTSGFSAIRKFIVDVGEMHTVAAVIPVRNRPDTLVRAVRSVQLQDRPIEEIILVDDASDDDRTAQMCRELAAADKRIKVCIHSVRGGGGAARNTGILNATADWIAFLDSDDEWLPTKTSKQLSAIRYGDVANFVASVLVTNGVREAIFAPRLPATFLDLQKANVLGPTSCALARRTALLQIGAFDTSLPSCQDWDLWIRLYAQDRFSALEEPLVLFHQDTSNRISKNKKAVIAGHRALLGKIVRTASQQDRRTIKASFHRRIAEIQLSDLDQPVRAIVNAGRSVMFERVDAWMARGIIHRAVKRVLATVNSRT